MKHLKSLLEYKTEAGKEFQIFQDMDGCLTDFEGNFKNIKANKDNLNPNEYDSVNGKFSMWRLIEPEGIEWWSEMPWKEDGKQLWNYIKQYDPIILSAPSRDADSSRGKMIWIERELGISQPSPTVSPKNHRWDEDSKVILNGQKYMFNKRYPNSILIDDTERQIDNWVNSGGIGILHTSTEDTINQLKEIIDNL